MLGPHVVGVRIVVRRVLPGERGPSGGPAMTDLLGVCEEWTDTDLAVRDADGTLTRIPLADVVSGKPVPPRPGVAARVPTGALHRAALAMWPGLVTEPLGEWVLRAAPTETARRANSVLAVGDPGVPAAEARRTVTAFAAAHGVDPVACVVVGSPAHDAFTDAGWGRHRPGEGDTLVQVASLPRVRRALAAVPRPDQGVELAEDGPRVQVALPGASGRAAYDADLLGLYAIETEPAHRRRGLALAALDELLAWGAERGARTAYLQVHETNAPALALYERLGFVTHHAYRYLVPAG